MCSRRILASAAVAALALSGCASDAGDDSASAGGESDEQQVDTANAEGLVAVNEEEQTLEFVDPESGEANLSLEFDGPGDISWKTNQETHLDRAAFSVDWQYVAWTNGDAQVDIARVNPDSGAYEVVSKLSGTGEESYSDEAVSYKNPRFAPDGETLWVESFIEGETETTLVSVEYEDAGENVEPTASDLSFSVDPVAPSYEHWRFDGQGQPVMTLPGDAETVDEDQFSAQYWTDDDGQVIHADFKADGDCEQLAHLDDGDFMLRDCDDAAIARAAVDSDAEKVEFTEVVANGKDTISRAYLSPDQDTALLVAGNDEPDWYRANLDDADAEPEAIDRGPVALSNGAVVLAWQ